MKKILRMLFVFMMVIMVAACSSSNEDEGIQNDLPTSTPTVAVGNDPTAVPNTEPTQGTDETPTVEPTQGTDETPTDEPEQGTDETPTSEPTQGTESTPTAEPTQGTESTPTAEPTQGTEGTPTTEPTQGAASTPTAAPTQRPQNTPTTAPTATPTTAPTAAPSGDSIVYMTSEISAESLIAIYEALSWQPSGNIAVKLSTGEPGSNYLRTDLIGDLVESLNDPTIVECNTAYGGSRSSTAMHYQVAEDHGYTAIADVDIMDENGSMSLVVNGGTNLTENYVGANFANYDSFLVLSHFKGHAMAGFGGAIKNISIGIASSAGKTHIHTAGNGGSMWGAPQDPFLESMAEAGKSVVEALDGQIVYINVMNRLSVDCDCDGNPSEPDMHDIGILASYDPVALDQACVDLVYAASDGASLVRRIEGRNGIHTLEHAEEIGLGSRSYEIVNID